ncbi:MAG: hypothetical protein HOI49_03865 [Bacteroidetes bacterium]|jgi:hypothetical protein|nr:hypothetical protein [Bacteroidota bacterium]
MKDSQEYILIRSLELRHSPWISEMDNPNQLQDGGTHRSFIIQFNDSIDRISMLIHFKHLSILKMELCYRKKGAENRKKKKQYPQHKMRLSFDNTLELLTYLSSKNYKADWFEIRFKNGWVIQHSFINGLEFITNNTQERNLLFERLVSLSGQGPIDIDSLEINQTYTLHTDGRVKLKPLFF